jgi:carboxypeptidase Taq
LQDVHWSAGNFGYFPSYALGYMYAAQISHAMQKDLPEYDQLLKNGDLLPIKHWLNEKIHRYGKTKKPLEIIRDVTGEPLSARYLTDYLTDKYSRLYDL